MKVVWLRRRNEQYHRYALDVYDCEKLYNGDYTRIFGLKKYWGDGDDWKPFASGTVYVDIETLLSEFILIDSPTDKYIRGLEELRDNNFKKESEASISVLTDAFADIQQPQQEDTSDPEGEINETN